MLGLSSFICAFRCANVGSVAKDFADVSVSKLLLVCLPEGPSCSQKRLFILVVVSAVGKKLFSTDNFPITVTRENNQAEFMRRAAFQKFASLPA